VDHALKTLQIQGERTGERPPAGASSAHQRGRLEGRRGESNESLYERREAHLLEVMKERAMITF
jgi:hypothetical protein